jgi:hypothetical protein
VYLVLLDPEDGGRKLLSSAGTYLPVEMALHPRGLELPSTPPGEPKYLATYHLVN